MMYSDFFFLDLLFLLILGLFLRFLFSALDCGLGGGFFFVLVAEADPVDSVYFVRPFQI